MFQLDNTQSIANKIVKYIFAANIFHIVGKFLMHWLWCIGAYGQHVPSRTAAAHVHLNWRLLTCNAFMWIIVTAHNYGKINLVIANSDFTIINIVFQKMDISKVMSAGNYQSLPYTGVWLINCYAFLYSLMFINLADVDFFWQQWKT